jgi:hypothetical protein
MVFCGSLYDFDTLRVDRTLPELTLKYLDNQHKSQGCRECC